LTGTGDYLANVEKADFLKPNTPAEKAGYTVEQVAEFFAPIPGSRAAKATLGAGKAAKLGRAGLEAAEVAGRTATQTGDFGKTELAAGVASPIVGGVVTKAGEALFNRLPKRFVRSALNQNLRELRAGKDVSGYVLDKKRVGSLNSMIDKTKKSMQSLNKAIDDKISSQKITNNRITRREIFDALEQTQEAAEAGLDKIDLADIIKKAVPRSKAFLDNKQMSVKNANQLRQRIDDALGDKYFLNTETGTQSKEILYKLRRLLADRVKGISNTAKEFDELSKEITLLNALDDLSLKDRNQILNFGDLIGAGIGAGIGGAAGAPSLGGMAGIAGRRAIQSMDFLTRAGVTTNELRKAVPILKKLTPAERGVLSQIIQKLSQQ
jgi:hypothetical protein